MNSRRILLPLLVLAVIVPLQTRAELRGPAALDDSKSDLERVELRSLPRVDVASLLREDRLADRKDQPLRVGLPVHTDFSPATSGTWERSEDGAERWRLRVRSDGARWLVLGFDLFRLPPGAQLSVYDPAGRIRLGPFGAADVRDHGQLWLPPIDGDTLVLELHWPASLRGRAPALRLGTISHGYKSAWGGDLDVSPGDDDLTSTAAGICNVDVGCPLGDAFRQQSRGVVQLLTGGLGFCTGTMIATTAHDCRPYLLTASHCVDTAQKAASTIIRFGYENSLCEGGTAPKDWTMSGATLRATYGPSDFSLLELQSPVPETYEPYFNGWSRSSGAPAASWGIHHPGNGVKKISYNEDPLVHGQFWGASHWRVTEWEVGTTENGSSGSPLFDPAGHVVGQLHGGYASCQEATWDEYGKLSHSWWGGGTPATRLLDWLDPLGTGAFELDGTEPASCQTTATDPPARASAERAPRARRGRGPTR